MELGNLMKDLRGHVAELKKIYFTGKNPITDDETELRNFCVKLEHILRFGQKEKYSLIGGKKDYWNFLAEALPKDDTIRFVQALGDNFKTYQGRGRAFIRQALVEKTLADTLQRCVIHHKAIREWYHHASVLRDPELLGILLHSLYDLNSVEFTLPFKDYDLDRAWPSFARKSFSNGPQIQRHPSVTDVDGTNKDPLPEVSAQVDAIKCLVAESSGKAYAATEAMLKEVSVSQVLQGLTEVYHDLELWKEASNEKVDNLLKELKMVKKEKESLERETKAMNTVQETLIVESERVKEYCGKYKEAELELKSKKGEINVLKDNLKEERCKAEENVRALQKEIQTLNGSLLHLSSEMSAKTSREQELMAKISLLEESLRLRESVKEEMERGVAQLKSALMQREIEIESLKTTFEKATGIMAGSFKEFEMNVSQSVAERENAAFTEAKNKTLYVQYESSKLETEALRQKITEIESDLAEKIREKEKADKVIHEIKEKFAQEKERMLMYEDVVGGIVSRILKMDSVDGVTDDEDGLTRKNDKKWVVEKLNVIHSQLVDTIKDKEEFESQALALKAEVAQLTERVEEMRAGFEDEINLLTQDRDEARQKVEELNAKNEKIVADLEERKKELETTLAELHEYHEQLATKSSEVQKLKEALALNEEEMDAVKMKRHQYEREKISLEEEVELKEEQIRILGMDSEVQVTELHGKVEELSKKLFELQLKHSEAESALSSRIDLNLQLDRTVADLKEQLKSLRQTKDQEIKALKFQLSSEEMKHEGALRALGDKMRECDEHSKAMEEREKALESVKEHMHDGHESWVKEREILLSQADTLNEEISELREKLLKLESELSVLEHELLRTTKQRDEEKSQRIIQAEKLELVLSDSRAKEKSSQMVMELLQKDVQELKSHLIAVTKEKSDLWQRSDFLEFELKQRSEGRWMNDEEAIRCSYCKEEFSLLIRKHHCRICGHIFCAMCSNNWVQTQHSRKRVRACNDCAHLAPFKASLADEGSASPLDESPQRETMLTPDALTEKNIMVDTASQEPSAVEPEDTYEVLTNQDVDDVQTSIGEITLLASDMACEPLLPSLTSDDEICKEIKKVQIQARQRFMVPVVVGNGRVDLCWEFTSYPKDVGFGMVYKKDEQTNNADIETIMPLIRYPSDKKTVFGRIKVEKPGIYILLFDNMFSRLTSKEVTCSIGLQPRLQLH